MQDFQSQWNFDGLHVADSALYSEANLQQLSGLKWLTRVPLTLKAASQVVTDLPDCAFSATPLEGYRIATVCSDYGGGKQRWFVVESQSRKHADVQQLENTLNQSTTQGQRQLRRLCAQEFACEADALKALERFEQSLKWHQLASKGVKPVLHYWAKRPNVPLSGGCSSVF